MTNIRRILSFAGSLDIGIRQAVMLAAIHELRFATAEQLSELLTWSPKICAAHITKLRNANLIRMQGYHTVRKMTNSLSTHKAWRLTDRVSVAFDDVEARAPLVRGSVTKFKVRPRKPAARAGKTPSSKK